MTVKASVVIPAYNASKFIVESIASVVAQKDAPPFEVIVVDDGSRDETAELIEGRFPTVRVIRKANGGPGSARNLGVENAESDIILFHDADDVMLEGRIAHQMAFMIENPDVAVSFGSQLQELRPHMCQVEELDLVFGAREFVTIENAFQRLVTQCNIVIGTSAAIRRSVYLSVGGQPEDVMVAEDYALYLAVARQYPIAATRRKYTWYRQSHGTNLMASASVYIGVMTILGRELEQFFSDWDAGLRRESLVNFNDQFNRFARYTWAYESREQLEQALSRWKPYLSLWMLLKWRVIPILVPPSVGRGIRTAKHKIRATGRRVSIALGIQQRSGV